MIDPQKLELGMRIVHAKDGFGTIERLDQSSNICTVKYDSGITANGLDTSLICKSSITPEEEAFNKNLADFNRNLELLKNSVNKILQKSTIHVRMPFEVIMRADLEQDEYKLIASWMNKPDLSLRKLRPMASARIAEVAMIKYFKDVHGQKPIDVSIEKITKSIKDENLNMDCNRWKEYDIIIDSMNICVINTRLSVYNSLGTRSEGYICPRHCIPEYKKNRDYNGVHVASLISISSNDFSYPFPKDGSVVRYSGITNKEQFHYMFNMLDRSIFEIKSTHLDDYDYFPSWIFHYSHGEYQTRDQLIESACITVKCRSFHENDCLTDIILPIITTSRKLNNVLPLDMLVYQSWKYYFVEQLNKNFCRYGNSISVMYLTLLNNFFCTIIQKNMISEFDPGFYEKVFYGGNCNRNMPCYIADKELNVYTLLSLLKQMWGNKREDLKSLVKIEFDDFKCLKGYFLNGTKPLTLLAHCGGKLYGSNGHKPCGNHKLAYGLVETCKCLSLICPDCGYCNKGCSKRKERQKIINGVRYHRNEMGYYD